MKEYPCFVPFVLLCCFTIACQDNAARAELEKVENAAQIEEQNKALVRQFFVAIDAQDFDRFNGLLAPGAILRGASPQEDITAENSAQLLRPVYQGLPDLAHIVEDMFAKGDKVVARVLIQATHKG